jgi:hypothetical protein
MTKMLITLRKLVKECEGLRREKKTGRVVKGDRNVSWRGLCRQQMMAVRRMMCLSL